MLEEIVMKHVLKNAYEHGIANEKAVAGKVVAEYPDARKEMKLVMEKVRIAISETAPLSKEEIGERMKSYSFSEKKPEEERKFRLPGIEQGKVVTRFLPEPNGFLHIGHAKAAWLSSELARQYGGKCILRFDDTNPEAESQDFVDAIRQSLKWAGLEFSSENFTSDRMAQLQNFGGKMVILNRAYVCTCAQDVMKANRFSGKPCDCRDRKAGENFSLWGGMIAGKLSGGEAVLRFRGDMASVNTAMRDPTLFRIIAAPHFRQGTKYFAWPTYDFEVSISDSLDGITHALRSKEYELRDELYYAILSAANLRRPVVYDFSRLSMKGTLLSKRFLKPLIGQNKVLGWDDPRLPTLDGLKRRGILPLAIREFVLRQGLSKVESEPEFSDLLAINRRMLDPKAPHYFFIPAPEKLIVEKIPGKFAEGVILAGSPSGAPRKFRIGGEFHIPGADAGKMEVGSVVRLKDLFNVKILGKSGEGIKAEFAGEGMAVVSHKIQWLPAGNGEAIPCDVMEASDLLDGKGDFNENGLAVNSGLCERSCEGLELGEIVQFERYGFCRLDKKEEGKLVFIFSC
ncbi:MAG TPA: glutamate--tRNA ligase [Candidatus Norongarragalinales archaeon]|nr:glutamate--tRNA ligase [Candidatus Norongarragalinales archaeon]